MSPLLRMNTVSTSFSGDKVLEADNSRGYFFIVFTAGDGSLEFGGGGGKIPLEEGDHYYPPVCPIGEIKINGAGATYTLHMG
ncbi:unnamed protein product [marine sediment metagenome]|uniref:Uncharacterized protein n=1 Tax=marine sediment metagenome TaxID=412755 RepID=X0X3V9_9ZZZZ